MDDLWDPVVKPMIRLLDAAGVHVVLVIGHDQTERRWMAKATSESGQWADVVACSMGAGNRLK